MLCRLRADSRFAPSQWEMALFCNDVSHWLGVNLESALRLCRYNGIIGLYALVCRILMIHVYGLLEERFIRRVLSWKGSISFLPWKWDIFLEECLKHGSYIYIHSLENTTWLTKLICKSILTNISLLWFGFCYINFAMVQEKYMVFMWTRLSVFSSLYPRLNGLELRLLHNTWPSKYTSVYMLR